MIILELLKTLFLSLFNNKFIFMDKIFLTFLIYYFATESNAYAYLDPATGSIIVQYIVAGLAACMVFMKNLRVKFKYFFSKIVTPKIKKKKIQRFNKK